MPDADYVLPVVALSASRVRGGPNVLNVPAVQVVQPGKSVAASSPVTHAFTITTDSPELLRAFLDGFGYDFAETPVHVSDLVRFLTTRTYNPKGAEIVKIHGARWAERISSTPGLSAKAAFIEMRDTIRALPWSRWGCMLKSCTDGKGREWWLRSYHKHDFGLYFIAFPRQNGNGNGKGKGPRNQASEHSAAEES
jgi:hypothetical protein